jgi:hypothetical protein
MLLSFLPRPPRPCAGAGAGIPPSCIYIDKPGRVEYTFIETYT